MATWQGTQTLILSGAPETDVSYVRTLLCAHPGMKIVCADAGVQQLDRLRLSPDLIVGDFDSSTRPDLQCECIQLIPEKDDTDTMHALQVIIDRGCTEVWIACATGGRLDHLLSNLSLCEYAHTRGCRCTIVDAQNELTFLAPGETVLEPDTRYRYFSLIPLDFALNHLTITGAKYNISDASVERTQIYTVSNEIAGSCARIELGQGRAFLIRSADRH